MDAEERAELNREKLKIAQPQAMEAFAAVRKVRGRPRKEPTTGKFVSPRPKDQWERTLSESDAITEVSPGFFLDPVRLREDKNLVGRLREKVLKRIAGPKGANLILDGLFQLAEGVWYHKEYTDRKGNVTDVKVYKEKPDLKALQYLLDRALGSPTKQLETFDKVAGIKTMADMIKEQEARSTKKQSDGQGE